MTERNKKLLRWFGYPALGSLAFVFALHFTFPYERLRERLVAELSREVDVGIAEISPGWLPGRVTVTGVTITTRPANDDDKPRTLVIDEVDLSIGFLALITRTISVDIDASIGGGHLEGNVRTSSSGLAIDMRTEDLSLESVPGIGVVTGGAPIKGPFVARFELDLPKNKWANAGGLIELSCDGCSIGDGVTKVRPMNPSQQNAFTNAGMTLPRIGLGKFSARIPISKGVACLERFEAKGGDVELTLEGGVRFADPFDASQAELQARTRDSEAFKRAAPQNAAIFASAIKDSEGFTTHVAKSKLVALHWRPTRTVLTPLRECEGLAPPPSAPKTETARTTPPANPVPDKPDEERGEDPAPATPPAPTPAPPAPEPAPEPTPTPAAAEPSPPAPELAPDGTIEGAPPPPEPGVYPAIHPDQPPASPTEPVEQ